MNNKKILTSLVAARSKHIKQVNEAMRLLKCENEKLTQALLKCLDHATFEDADTYTHAGQLISISEEINAVLNIQKVTYDD
jgi:hypothetical protein